MKSLFTSSKKYAIIESPSKKLVYGTKRAARGDIMVKKEMIGSSTLREKQRQRLVYWNRKCDLPESGVHGVLQSGIRSDPFR